MEKILIIEDDEDIAELERDYLEAAGFQAEILGNGQEGEKRALDPEIALVLLDIMLPGEDGFQVCRKIREQRNIPILLVSAKQEDVDKIRGLGLGADDYIVKPFSPSELVARVRAHLKRYQQLTGQNQASKLLIRGDLTIDCAGHRVYVGGKEVVMPNKEFALLEFLWVENPGRYSARRPCSSGFGERTPGRYGYGFRPCEPNSEKIENPRPSRNTLKRFGA